MNWKSVLVKVMAISAIGAILIGALALDRLPRIYVSTATIEIGHPDSSREEANIMRSYRILTNVIAVEHLSGKQTGLPPGDPDSLYDLFDCLYQNVAVRVLSSNTFEISSSNADPIIAAKIANAVPYSYRQYRVETEANSRFVKYWELTNSQAKAIAEGRLLPSQAREIEDRFIAESGDCGANVTVLSPARPNQAIPVASRFWVFLKGAGLGAVLTLMVCAGGIWICKVAGRRTSPAVS